MNSWSETNDMEENVKMELKEMVNRLIAIIQLHCKLHRDLLSVMEEKKALMVEGQIDEMERVVARECAAIEAISESEDERIAVIEEIAATLGYPGSCRLRLLDLINLVGDEQGERLLELRDELREIADHMDRVNQLNRTLALHSLEHVHLFLSLLRGNDPQAKIYTKGGEKDGKSESILVDRRI